MSLHVRSCTYMGSHPYASFRANAHGRTLSRTPCPQTGWKIVWLRLTCRNVISQILTWPRQSGGWWQKKKNSKRFFCSLMRELSDMLLGMLLIGCWVLGLSSACYAWPFFDERSSHLAKRDENLISLYRISDELIHFASDLRDDVRLTCLSRTKLRHMSW